MKFLNEMEWSNAGPALIRLLIVSYIAGIAIGLIPGTPFAILGIKLMSLATATVLVNGLVLILCGMVVADISRRPAALVLALLIFWAGYLTLFSAHAGTSEVGAFWRDLAIIGGLLAVVRDRPEVVTAPEARTDGILSVTYEAPEPRRTPRGVTKFREDLEFARAS